MSILSGLLKKAFEVVSMISHKPKFTDVVLSLVGWIPSLISQVGAIGEMDSKEKVDEALQALDDFTGSDPDALDLIRDLPAEKEEALFDHLKEVIRILVYNRLKIAGYYVETE